MNVADLTLALAGIHASIAAARRDGKPFASLREEALSIDSALAGEMEKKRVREVVTACGVRAAVKASRFPHEQFRLSVFFLPGGERRWTDPASP